jgi:hypothetical protein
MDKITSSLLSDFSKDFGVEKVKESDRFEQFAAWLVVRRHFSDSTFLPADLHTGGGSDTGIDAIAVIVNNNLVTDVDTVEELLKQNGFLDVTFVFVQAERSASFSTAKIGNFVYGVRDFFGDSKLDKNEVTLNYCEIMSAVYKHAGKFKHGNPTCHMYYVTTGTWKEDKNLVTRIEAEKSSLEDTNLFRKVDFTPIGATEIQMLYRQNKNDVTREFLFERRQSIPSVEGVKEAYIGIIPASELLKVVRDEKDDLVRSLFYENPRDWTGYKGINGEIKNTLSSEENDRFVLMNNGVTIIARTLQLTGDQFTISGFHVVNGCQTCNVLHDNSDKITDAVRVPLRVICTQDQGVVESIIRATNRQTEVKEDQFFAMTAFAKKLEDYFKAFPADRRLYYERRSNQYDSETIEKQRIVVHQNLVRAVGAMFLGDAHITTKNFSALRSKVGEQIFKDDDRMEPYYVAAVALYRLERLFRTKLDAKYKAARYQILLAVRLMLHPEQLPQMSAKDVGKICDQMASKLWDDKAAKLFVDAAALVDDVAGSDWDRDSVRIEKVTKEIFLKFGQTYYGRRQEKAATAAS